MKLTEDKPFQLKQVKGTIVDTKNQISWNFTEKNIIRIEVESGNRKLFYEVNDEFNQNKKLRELIEKRIEEIKQFESDMKIAKTFQKEHDTLRISPLAGTIEKMLLTEFQKLLEENKK